MIALVVVPAGALMVVLARPIITGALDYGNFSAASVTTTATTLAWFGAGLFAFSAYLYTVRGMYAHLDTRTPFMVNLLENAVNIGLAVVLYPRLGVRGLAISWSVAYSVAAIVAWVLLQRRMRGLEGGRTLGVLIRIAAASAVGAAAAWGIDRAIDPSTSPAAIATVVVLHAIGVWNELILATIYLTKDDYYPITRGLIVFNGVYGNNWPLLAAAVLMIALPMAVLFVFIQRYIVGGVTAGAVKG